MLWLEGVPPDFERGPVLQQKRIVIRIRLSFRLMLTVRRIRIGFPSFRGVRFHGAVASGTVSQPQGRKACRRKNVNVIPP